MKPLSFAILKHFTKVKEACAEDVIEALKGQYGSYKGLNTKEVVSTLMTAEANGLLEETRFEMDQNDVLKIYYHAHKEGAETINNYIPD